MSNAPIPPLLPVYRRTDITLERGEGAYLIDTAGRRYLDFGTGIAVTLLGHSHPHLVAAIKDQAERLMHCSNLYHTPQQQMLAERLVAQSFADTVFFCNSGAEALECAIKMARRFHFQRGQSDRHRIVTFGGAFHGRTMATISAGGQQQYLEGFAPALSGFDAVPLNDLDATEAAIGPHTAAVLVEPIQGEGGIRVADDAFLQRLRQLCDERDLLLILDEVQTGMGRTGQLFAYQEVGVSPDIMTLAKGLGGGFPIGACLATARAAAGMVAGTHGSTFGGNPLACAAGNAVLDVLLEESFLSHVRATAARLREGVLALAEEHPTLITEVRGRGLMIGLRLAPPAAEVAKALMRHGLLTVPAGDNVVRLLPPLIIDEAEIEAALAAWRATLAELARAEAAA